MNILSIKDFFLFYGKKAILKNINLELKKNKIIAIIGPSGCGKSTLLKSINGIVFEENSVITSGEILFEKEEDRKKVGLIFQNPTPFPVSIYKNLVYAPIYYGIKKKAELDKIVEEVLKKTGLYEEIKDELHKSALKLSGGQQQRLCIARGLTTNPKILLLDEPCSSLDLISTKKIEELLKKLSENLTIVIVTHNLAQAKRISDYTVFMLNGEVVEIGKTSEIFSSPQKDETKKYIGGIYG